jgi:hypothetical protein
MENSMQHTENLFRVFGGKAIIESVVQATFSSFTRLIDSVIGDFLLSEKERFSIDGQGCEYYHEIW